MSRYVGRTTEVTYQAEEWLRQITETLGPGEHGTIFIHGSTIDIVGERRFVNLDQVQSYVDQVRSRRWVWAKYPEANSRPVRVIESKSRYDKAVMHTSGSMSLHADPEWLRQLVVLHELSHHLAWPYSGHGKEFRDTMVELVGEEMGPGMGLLLRIAYDTEVMSLPKGDKNGR